MHLNIEPEPDGLIGNGLDFFHWYTDYLLPLSHSYLTKKRTWHEAIATEAVTHHVRLCYDVCHFAVGYEDPVPVLTALKKHGIKIGKLQISVALKAHLPVDENDRAPVINAFRQFNEDTYLHQVIAQRKDSSLMHYRDLPQALGDAANPDVTQWRGQF